eukprot:TRINITY_DN65744_c9_g1_i1.p2 TRINITY_DN65744_c9_g1~~TRINITY_DN65744_c9_g1_i1.p2  ORF type:complete len:253 (-),score=168.89 TRINITY_DN65744_c9_g1_i1:140-898(-)
MRPICVRQLVNAEADSDNRVIIDGKPATQVRLVGLVMSAQVENTYMGWELDDGTGVLRLRMYNDDQGNPKRPDIAAGMYVRVIGNAAKYMSNKSKSSSLIVFDVRPITDFNEVTYHLLEIVQTHLLLTKGAAKKAAAKQGNNAVQANNSNNLNNNNSVLNAGGNAGGNGQQLNLDSINSASASAQGFTPVQQRVLDVFRNNVHEGTGITIDAVCKALPDLSPHDVRQAVDFLAGDGHVYSTIDEHHFACTDM